MVEQSVKFIRWFVRIDAIPEHEIRIHSKEHVLFCLITGHNADVIEKGVAVGKVSVGPHGTVMYTHQWSSDNGILNVSLCKSKDR
jgi:hypothetical protein